LKIYFLTKKTMATLSLPNDPKYSVFYGDIDIFSGFDTANAGDGTLYVRSGGLYVNSLSDLNATTINTTNGEFHITGTNRIIANLTSSTGTLEFTAAGTTPSFFTTTAGVLELNATSATSTGKIAITAAGTGTDSILLNASNTTSGQIHLQSAGASSPSVIIESTNAGGQTLIQSAGTSASAINLNSSAGGILISATNKINLNTTDTTNGITVGTDTVGVPIRIGSTGSLTTIGGDLKVNGTTVTVNTVTLTVEDNALILNSANNSDGNDAGVAIRRYQIPSDTLTGSVIASLGPIQESGTAQAGAAGSITLAAYAYQSANTDDKYYKGWWIKIVSGTGANQIRRIKSYDGTNQVASIYVTSDNVTAPTTVYNISAISTGSGTVTITTNTNTLVTGQVVNITGTNSTPTINSSYVVTVLSSTQFTIAATVTVAGTAGSVTVNKFSDGLDWATVPDNTSVYSLYNSSYAATFYNETNNFWSFNTIADIEDGIISTRIQQPQNITSGQVDIQGKTYYNASVVATASTTVTIFIKAHGLTVGKFIKIIGTNNVSPAIPTTNTSTTNPYYVQSVSTDSFTITVPDSTTASVASGSNATVYFYNSSVLKTNVIESYDPEFPIQIPNITLYQDIIITKTSTALFPLTLTANFGAYLLLVSDISGTGASSVFACANSSTGNTPALLVSSKGAENQRIKSEWGTAGVINIYHSTPGSGAGSYTYRCRIVSAL
jgi:hypothetical protein